MRLATLDDGTRDGRLVIVSSDLARCVSASGIAGSLQQALDNWADIAPLLEKRQAELDQGAGGGVEPFDQTAALAPLPRAWQWLDASAFPSHGKLCARALGTPPIAEGIPLMYQGLSDRFLAPGAKVPLPNEEDGIDFEGEFGVIVDDVPMGTSASDALNHIKLIVQINDWSLRELAGREMKTGFGWVHAKPASAMAPVAVTPDELGDAWQDGRVALDLGVQWNGEPFGRANGAAMGYGFHDLVAHAARTRDLPAGTIIGSGNGRQRELSRSRFVVHSRASRD
jgi:fumarylacetoacetate (FAA) hydrolase